MNKDVTTLQYALEYYNQGFSVIPLLPKTKLAAVSWECYQTILASEDQIRTVDHLYHVAKGRDWQRLTSVSSYPNLLYVYGKCTRRHHKKRARKAVPGSGSKQRSAHSTMTSMTMTPITTFTTTSANIGYRSIFESCVMVN